MFNNLQLPFSAQSNHHHNLSLNPNAPEFHPHYYPFTPPNHNTTIIATNLNIAPNNYYDYYQYYYPHNPLPPPQQQYHHFNHPHVNSQEYPRPYYPHFDHHHTSNNTYYLHNYRNTLPTPNVIPLQAQPQPRVFSRAHIRGPSPTRARRKWPSASGGGVRARDYGSSGSVGNLEKKEGYAGKNNDEAIRVRVSVRSGRGKMGKMEVLKVKSNGWQTTAMIRNVPNQYTRAMLVEFLDEFCNNENRKLGSTNDDHPALAFDFVYIPIDFKRDANKGYAFVNFTHPIAVWKLHLACSDHNWDHCNSTKICQIAYALIQGKEKLMEHFGRSRFNCNQGDYLPVCFDPPRDGSGLTVKLTTIGERVSPSSSFIE